MFKLPWNFSAKIFTGHLIVILFLVSSISFLHLRISSLQNEIGTVTGYDREIAGLTNELEAYVIDMETGQRGFIISGEDTYLEPYTQARLKWEQTYALLKSKISGDPGQLQNLEFIRDRIEEWITVTGEPLIALKRANDELSIAQAFRENVGIKQVDLIRGQVDEFRQAENASSASRIEDQIESTRMLVLALYAVGVLIVGVSLAIAYITSKTVVRTITDVTTAIEEIASTRGDPDRRIEIQTRDEIGDLGTATNKLLASQQRQQLASNQTSDMNIMYQGIEDIGELSDRFLAKLSTIVDFQFGALYIREDQETDASFGRTAVYAGDGLPFGKSGFLAGEGLIGQSAKERNVIELNPAPEGYIRINSALGQSVAHSVYILPIEFQSRTLAVLELASLRSFTSHDKHMLKQITDSFGAVAQSVLNRMEIQRLYEVSQQLNEELQVYAEEMESQSETLRTMNKQLEEQNHYISLKSAEAVKARTLMEQYAAEARSNSKYKSQFLANMSHELRTPLNSMLVFSQFLEENVKGNLDEEELNYAKYIHTSGLDLLNLINDILDLSRVEAGMLNVISEPFSTRDLAEAMQRQFNAIAEKKKLGFEVVLDADVPASLKTDENRLQQILKNLIANAIKFTSEGFVELRIVKSVPDKMLQHPDGRLNGEIIGFIVKDTGIGIASHHLERIFEAFSQADETIERKFGGTGLGLSISRHLAELLGGKLFAESIENVGSTFTFLLPLHADVPDRKEVSASSAAEISAGYNPVKGDLVPVEPDSPGPDTSAVSFAGKVILVVDDDERNLLALTAPLQSRGMKVVAAESGQRAVELIHRQSFDLVLMDIMMPGMSGYNAIKAIRRIHPKLPIIAVTAKAMKQDRMESLEAGASDFMSKPIILERLLAMMRIYLGPS